MLLSAHSSSPDAGREVLFSSARLILALHCFLCPTNFLGNLMHQLSPYILCFQPLPLVSDLSFQYLFFFSSVQFSQSCPTLCDPMNRSTPGLPVHHQLPEFTQIHIHRVSDAIQPSHPVVPFSSCPQSLPASESFPMSQHFA